LLAGSGLRPVERAAVRRQAEHRDDVWLQRPNLRLQHRSPGAQLLTGQFVGTGAGGGHHVGDRNAQVRQHRQVVHLHPVAGVDLVGRDTRREQRRPEAVAPAREVRLCSSGPQAVVDADEQNAHGLADEVVDECAVA